MPFSRPSLDTIIARIEADITSRLTGGAALLRRALLKILARVFGGAIHTLYGFLDYLSIQVLPDLAEGTFLDRHAFSWGLFRIKATFAHGDVIFTGINGTTIPEGTVVVRDDDVEYKTTVPGSISGGVVTLDVQADVLYAGEDGNTDAGIEFSLLSPITDIDDICTVDSGGIIGGVDEETDEELRERVLHRIKNPPAGGSESDYVQAALSVAGVANAYIFPNQEGLVEELGHVTIVVLGDSPKVPGAPLLADVQTAADAIKPVTATIHTEPIDDAIIDLAISIDPNTSALQTAIETSIDELFTNEGTPGGDVLISHIRNAIIITGVDDYVITGMDVDGSPVSVGDISLTDFEYPVLGTITFATL